MAPRLVQHFGDRVDADPPDLGLVGIMRRQLADEFARRGAQLIADAVGLAEEVGQRTDQFVALLIARDGLPNVLDERIGDPAVERPGGAPGDNLVADAAGQTVRTNRLHVAISLAAPALTPPSGIRSASISGRS